MSAFHRWIDLVDRRHFAIFAIALSIAITGGVGIYFLQGISTQNALASQMLHREQIMTRSGANTISHFTNGVGRSLVLTATGQRLTSGSIEDINLRLKEFMEIWKGTPITGIAYIDKEGVVQANITKESSSGIGEDVSDRPYFIWSKTAPAGRFRIANPVVSRFGGTKGSYILPVAAPVYSNNEYKGVLVAVMPLDDMVEKFLQPLMISDKTMGFLLNNDGDFVFSTIPSFVGTNIKNIFDNIDFPGAQMARDAFVSEFKSTNREGKFDIYLPDLNNGNKITRFLITYSSLRIDMERSWTLIVMTPASDAFLFTGPYYRDQILSLIYVVIVSVMFAILGITSTKIGRFRRDG